MEGRTQGGDGVAAASGRRKERGGRCAQAALTDDGRVAVAQPARDIRRHRDQPGLAKLRVAHAQHGRIQIDIGVREAQRLAGAQAGEIEQGQRGAEDRASEGRASPSNASAPDWRTS